MPPHSPVSRDILSRDCTTAHVFVWRPVEAIYTAASRRHPYHGWRCGGGWWRKSLGSCTLYFHFLFANLLLYMYTYCILLCKTLLFARNKVDCDVGKSYFMNAECFSSVPPQSLPFLHPMPLTLGPKGGGGKNAWQHIFWGDENRGSFHRNLRHLFFSEHQSVSLMNRVKNKFHIRLFGSPIHWLTEWTQIVTNPH